MEENYQALIDAIIMQAVKDYRKAQERLKRHPGNAGAQNVIKDVERFFLSDWFVELTDLDGRTLMEQLRKEADSGEE